MMEQQISRIGRTAAGMMLAGLLLSACSSVAPECPEELKEKTIVLVDEDTAYLPGNLYLDSGLKNRMCATKPLQITQNENGVKIARADVQTAPLPFLEWLVTNDGPRRYSCQFIWFDQTGKQIESKQEPLIRSAMPGEAMRLTEKVPSPACVKFS